jgi:hypothetical protein
MADISDVEQAVANTVTAILYPAGSAQSSIIGALCRIYRGWPNSATLNADLSAGIVNVTVGADNDSGRTTTRYLPRWKTISGLPGTTANVSGETIAIAGSPAIGDVLGAIVDGVPFAYRIQAGDTPGLAASNLAQLIQATRPSSLQGSSITIHGASSVTARVVCDGVASSETRRQEKDLRIICWCPAPPVRDAVASAIDSAMNDVDFLSLPDSTEARITYRNTASYDQAQNALLYRRDLVYAVEYATITTTQQPSMLFGASDLNRNIIYG